MVILLVVKRKVLSSLLDGCNVISIGKDIRFAVSHICVNFPGADASQHGDFSVSDGGVFGLQKLCAVLLALTSKKHFNVIFKSCGIWLLRSEK